MSQNLPPSQPSFGPVPGAYGPPQPGFQAPQRTSAAAVTSLICGILGCLVITGIVAVITGIIGLKATSNPNVKGRGMAITGIILGVLLGLGGATCAGVSGVGFMVGNKEVNKVVAVADDAFAAANANDQAKFDACWGPGEIVPGDFIPTVRAWGTAGRFEKTYNGVKLNSVNGVTTCEVHGAVTFSKSGTKNWIARGIKMGDGSYKLQVLVPE